MSDYEFTPDEVAERDQQWAAVNDALDDLVKLLREHRPACTNPSRFCMGAEDGAPVLHTAAHALILAGLTGPEPVWLLWAALHRLLDTEGGE